MTPVATGGQQKTYCYTKAFVVATNDPQSDRPPPALPDFNYDDCLL